jgi:uncharacterized protein (DUF1800 family)
MDRKTSLKKLIGQRTKPAPSQIPQMRNRRNPVTTGLEKYTGPWTQVQAAHLLRRTTYGATRETIQEATNMGLDGALAQLLQPKQPPSPPLNYYYQDDPFVPVGQSWIDAPYSADVNLFGHRNRSFNAWLMRNIYEEENSLTEKMIVFWHNHFVTADINDPKFDFDYFKTLREHALGNFRQFVKDMTINPSMLRYLNGNQNTKNAPNENYARELLELFTIGKGPLAGPGDYTNYTEEDIGEIARALTGWKDNGFRTLEDIPVGSTYLNFRHDKETKTLSHRFDNIQINDMGEEEYAHLIDIILQKKEVARFIARKLYRWFIYHDIDETTENLVIEPLAGLLFNTDYEIKPALEALLSSQHFYDFINNGCLIKNPVDFVFSAIKSLKVALPGDKLFDYYNILLLIYNFVDQLQMNYGNPPSVSGWKAYYQAPSYYEIWINSVTLPYRMNFTKAICLAGIKQGGNTYIVDVLDLVDSFPDPGDINALINELVVLLFPQQITEKQIDYLKEILIPGLPDFEWSVEYSIYKNNPDDENIRRSLEIKLRLLLDAMLSMPEFYLS